MNKPAVARGRPLTPMRQLTRHLPALACALLLGLAVLAPASAAPRPERAPLTTAAAISTLERAVSRIGDGVRRGSASPQRSDRPHYPVDGPHHYGEAAALFGASRGGRSHAGQDVFAASGTPLVAVRDGRVVESGTDGGRGNYVIIYAPRPDQTYVYLHMVGAPRHAAGDRVRAGERLGGVGCTGSCWGDHLHFEIHEGRDPYGAAINPLPLLERWDKRGPMKNPYG